MKFEQDSVKYDMQSKISDVSDDSRKNNMLNNLRMSRKKFQALSSNASMTRSTKVNQLTRNKYEIQGDILQVGDSP